MTELGGQRLNDRGLRTEAGGQRIEDRGRRSYIVVEGQW